MIRPVDLFVEFQNDDAVEYHNDGIQAEAKPLTLEKVVWDEISDDQDLVQVTNLRGEDKRFYLTKKSFETCELFEGSLILQCSNGEKINLLPLY